MGSIGKKRASRSRLLGFIVSDERLGDDVIKQFSGLGGNVRTRGYPVEHLKARELELTAENTAHDLLPPPGFERRAQMEQMTHTGFSPEGAGCLEAQVDDSAYSRLDLPTADG